MNTEEAKNAYKNLKKGEFFRQNIKQSLEALEKEMLKNGSITWAKEVHKI